MQEFWVKICSRIATDAGIELSEYPNEQLKGVFNLLGVRSLNQLLVDIGSGRKRSNLVSQSFAEV